MIRQQIGDVLEINFGNGWYYVVVLTNIVLFGGNIVFAYHNDGKKMGFEQLQELKNGFNICVDLLWVKRQGLVSRIGKFAKIESFFKTKYLKRCFETQRGKKASRWFIYDINDLRRQIAVVNSLPKKYREAMDSGTYSFDLVVEKIHKRYTPSQNEHI